jgi:hypothetical protein
MTELWIYLAGLLSGAIGIGAGVLLLKITRRW